MTPTQAFMLGVYQACEIMLLPFILCYEWVRGVRLDRLNEDL